MIFRGVFILIVLLNWIDYINYIITHNLKLPPGVTFWQILFPVLWSECNANDLVLSRVVVMSVSKAV